MLSLCGIDEAGRGPVAGPLIMAGVILNEPVEGLCDSKQLSAKRREALYDKITDNSRYHIIRFSNDLIDDKGISVCLRHGLEQIMDAMKTCDFLFDGNSTFGASGLRTMVKADVHVPEVSAASILAKVSRDREMIQLAHDYPQYGFASHKGYITKAHIEAIKTHGYCPIHRRSYTIKALQNVIPGLN